MNVFAPQNMNTLESKLTPYYFASLCWFFFPLIERKADQERRVDFLYVGKPIIGSDTDVDLELGSFEQCLSRQRWKTF